MRNFLIAAAAMTAFAALVAASVPAQADMHYGPSQNAGKCFKWSTGSGRDSTFGYWDDCPKPASTAAKPAKPAPSQPAKR